ncbi:MAG: DUF4190 domain-containing protein [Catenulispora sp.]|nr:DUF4190 domain-containing protein [Catenulispora sp.]
MDSETGPEVTEASPSGEPDAGGTPFAPVDPAPPFPSAPASQPDPGQTFQGQQYPGQPYPGQPYPGQPYPGQPYPAPPYPGQPYPAQSWPGYGQGPAGPYGYAPYGYGVPHAPAGTNGMAVAALVLGICGFFFITPIVGLVLGLVALSAVRRSGQKGKGLAISGIVLSSLWIALFAGLITVAAVTAPDPVHRDAAGNVVKKGSVPVFSLRPKDCFTVPAGMIGSTESHLKDFTVVPCSTPHDSETVGSFTATESSFPGIDALRAEGRSQCFTVLTAYLTDVGSLPNGSIVQFVYPNEQAWAASKHRVVCFIQFPAANVTKLLYHDAASYTPDQRRFLDAERPLINELAHLSATRQSEDLPALRERANAIATATRNDIAALTSASWPADVQPNVDVLVSERRAAGELWTKAASAPDVETFSEEAEQAVDAVDPADIGTVRSALALPVTSGVSSPSGSFDSSDPSGSSLAA